MIKKSEVENDGKEIYQFEYVCARGSKRLYEVNHEILIYDVNTEVFSCTCRDCSVQRIPNKLPSRCYRVKYLKKTV